MRAFCVFKSSFDILSSFRANVMDFCSEASTIIKNSEKLCSENYYNCKVTHNLMYTSWWSPDLSL